MNILITCLPSAVTSYFKEVRRNVPLSICLTATTCLLAFITIPIIIKVYYLIVFQDQSTLIFNKGLIPASLKIFAIVTIPVILGIIFNTIFPDITKKIDPTFDKISALLFVFIVGIAVYQDLHLIPEYIKFAGVKTVLIFVLAFFMTNMLSKLFQLNESDKITITIETVLQNGGMESF